MEPLSKKSLLLILKNWVEINSYSKNLTGLLQMKEALIHKFSSLQAKFTEHPLTTPWGSPPLLLWEMRKKAPHQVLFGGHYDTVFPPHSPFQKMAKIGPAKYRGPGILDMKSGLLMIWMVLSEIEKSPWKEQLGWKVLINPDEEIGSLYSKKKIAEVAQGSDFALWFEPALNRSTLIHKRAASLNLEISVIGRKAHVGRDYSKGRSAVDGLVFLLHDLRKEKTPSLLLNIGEIQGGSGLNTVADSARAGLNIRAFSEKTLVKFEESVEKKGKVLGETMDLVFSCKRLSYRLPKPYSPSNQKLFREYIAFAKTEGFPFVTKGSFGVTDSASLGNMACIDTLGAVGEHLHTEQEWADIDSLYSRSQLLIRFLQKKAAQ